MSVLSAEGVSKSYGADEIISNASFKVQAGDKIGVVGVNGTGKTTLLRILAGEEEADSGTVVTERGLVISYMRQNGDLVFDGTALEAVIDSFGELKTMEAELEKLAARIETAYDAYTAERYRKLSERFADGGGLTFRSRAASALTGLGLRQNEISLPVRLLSGGQRARVLLARALLSGAGLLLLDEPTNHLDIEASEWLEDFLASYGGAVMVVSHDRFFLDRVCGRIFEIENSHVTVYEGNYTRYKEKKAFDRKTLQRDYESKQSEIKRIEGIIEQQKRFNQARNYVTIKSKQKQIDRIKSTVVVPEKEPSDIRFKFTGRGNCGTEVLKCSGLSMAYGTNTLFEGADIYIRKGQKVFLAGANGKGKSTLLRIITGEERPLSGDVCVGAGVKIGYYAQDRLDLDDGKNIFEIISDAYPFMKESEVRSALGAFLFRGDDVFKPVRALSGGERARVSLARLMLSDTNFLILDEPTNHLDISSKEALEKALIGYDGTVLAVSHDRYFVDRVADRIYYISNGRVKCHDGDYTTLLAELRKDAVPSEKQPSPGGEIYRKRKEETALQRKREKRKSALERLIADSEAELAGLSSELELPENMSDYKKIEEISRRIQSVREEMDGFYSEWIELSDN